MKKRTPNKPAYPAWLQEWKTQHAKPGDELLAYNGDEAVANLRGIGAIAIFSQKNFAVMDEGITWDYNKGITYRVVRGKWQLIGRKQPLYVVDTQNPQSVPQYEVPPPQPTRETCKERKWYVAKDVDGEWYVSKGPVFVIGPAKDVDITVALDTLALIHVDGGKYSASP